MVFRSTDPTTYDDLDGIVIAERSSPASIQGASSNVAILVGHFERGPYTMTSIGSTRELTNLFGGNYAYSGLAATARKKFGALKVIRVEAGSAAKASYTFDNASAADTITFTAKYKGVYGNSITVTIAAGTTEGKKYTIIDTNSTSTLNTEVYDDVVITEITSSTFAESKLVDVTVVSSSAEPANASATALSGGSDGTVADANYQSAIALAAVENAGNFIFLDDYNTTRNGYIKTHVADTTDKIGILAGAEGDSVATAVSAVANLRDTDGRLIYAYNWVKTIVDEEEVYQSPASWLASILSQTAPNIDPAYIANVQYTAGAIGLKNSLTRTDYITLKDAGIAAFEYNADAGYKIKSGVTTQILDSTKRPIIRRRMADYLTTSAGRFLANYQNAVNSRENRVAVKGALIAFITQQENLGLLPKDSEVSTGLAKVVDIDSLNTDDTIADGYFYVLWRQRIYSSMRYIVLQAEIGTSVVVSEA